MIIAYLKERTNKPLIFAMEYIGFECSESYGALFGGDTGRWCDNDDTAWSHNPGVILTEILKYVSFS